MAIMEDEINKLLIFLVNTYFSRINNLDNNKISQLKAAFHSFVDNTENKEPHNAELCNKKRLVIDSFFEFMKKPEIIEKIKTYGIDKRRFIEKYGREILGDTFEKKSDDAKRKYSMNDLYLPNLIASDKFSNAKKEIFIPAKKNIEYEYIDKSGKIVKITLLGSLHFEEWNGVQSSINKYRIQRQTGENEFSDNQVYTTIIIPKMEDVDYREAVIEELLSNENIELSNCGGYIGKIENSNQAGEKGEEIQDNSGYSYRINNKYILYFDATEVAAAINFPVTNMSLTINLKQKDNQKSYGTSR